MVILVVQKKHLTKSDIYPGMMQQKFIQGSRDPKDQGEKQIYRALGLRAGERTQQLHLFSIKSLSKVTKEGRFFNPIERVCVKPTANILHCED